jgi:chemotaxis protein MotB
MAKKKAAAPEPAGESAPMWIVSFADLVTLMMSFFVVLYALKQGGPEQQLERTAAIMAQFGNDPPVDANDDLSMAIKRYRGIPVPTRDKSMGHADSAADGPEGPDPKVTNIRDGRQITSGGSILFDSGSTVVTSDAKIVIAKLAELVRGKTNILMIKGHVSADEIALRPSDPQGWTLSYMRATIVADELTKLGIDRRLLRPVPCGANEPLKAQVYDAETLKQNRRVVIYSTESTLSDYFPSSYVPAATEPATQEQSVTPETQPVETPTRK